MGQIIVHERCVLSPANVQDLLLTWLGVVSVLLTGLFALVKLFLTEWMALHKTIAIIQAQTNALDLQVNGAMTTRIGDGARAAIAADKAIHSS